ncbi:MAG TPA: hypothetical protein VFM27_10790 [Acidimicrobiales bacterium]|nr:hypothetical protein [Acidimicrobiales bacterium]
MGGFGRRPHRPARLVRSAAAGACVALAYLARPEGLLLAVPLGPGWR